MCVEIIEQYNKNIIADDRCQHIIAHAEFPKPWKEYQIGHKEKACPGYYMGKYCDEFLVVSHEFG